MSIRGPALCGPVGARGGFVGLSFSLGGDPHALELSYRNMRTADGAWSNLFVPSASQTSVASVFGRARKSFDHDDVYAEVISVT